MTSPVSPIETLRAIVNRYDIPIMILVRDSRQIDPNGRGISASKFWEIIEYGFPPKSGGRVEKILKMLISALRQKYPSESKEETLEKCTKNS